MKNISNEKYIFPRNQKKSHNNGKIRKNQPNFKTDENCETFQHFEKLSKTSNFKKFLNAPENF